MTDAPLSPAPAAAGPAVRIADVRLRYGKTVALDGVGFDVPAGRVVGLIGPDGVGKSSLLSLVSGAHAMQDGTIEVLDGDIRDPRHRDRVCPRIAYMPQGLGKNLYATLSVEENLQFFARLFGHGADERRRRIDRLTRATGLAPFLARPAGKLSGGMKQKLGLCCALIHDPDLLILDEPTTGVDPLARAQFWTLIDRVRAERPAMAVMVATAYMDEAMRFDWLAAMDDGRVLATGAPKELLEKTGADNLDAAFIALLPEEKRAGHEKIVVPPLEGDHNDVVIEAKGLTRRFGSFVAVDHVDFRIRRGEIFGFLGSNGSGKTTTMKMLTGLLPASEGEALLFGRRPQAGGVKARGQLGYMTQAFSLYGELTVRQNLVLHARLYAMPKTDIPDRVQAMLDRFDLQPVADALPEDLPLGVRQRLSLAVAVVHRPRILILDEPTSGVDPVARDAFWRLIIEISRQDGVTIFVTTHFMNEAERCDRIALMHNGRSLAADTPAALVKTRGAKDLEDAFIGYLRDAGADDADGGDAAVTAASASASGRHRKTPRPPHAALSLRRLFSCVWRESLELARDPIRATLALGGSLILMVVMGYGITMDVENLRFAALDHDDTAASRNYLLNLSGSRYFIEQPPIADYAELDRRMRGGELTMALEIPPGFARDLDRGAHPAINVWLDGAMPMRAETIRGYVEGMHADWLATRAVERGVPASTGPAIETRYRYNPDVKSLPAMVPAVIPILLLMLPAVLAALAVVREKEMGSIVNLYVTPLTRVEFMLGKQAPYVALSMVSFALLLIMAVTAFDVPVKGSLPTLVVATLAYCAVTTGLGLLASCVTKSQIAVMFLTMIATMLPAIQFSGLLNPVSSLGGFGRMVGEVYPTTHMLVISRGVFNKALSFADLHASLIPLFVAAPVVAGLAILLLRKQER